MNNLIKPKIEGYVVIKDYISGEIIQAKQNAIHYENMSQALAYSLGNRPSGFIDTMVFGNGASIESGTGALTYFPPNITGANASLYSQTYSQVVNDQNVLNVNPSKNYISVAHTTNNVYSDVIVTCFLDYNEPSGQDAFDNAPNSSDLYIFDELGLKSFDNGTGNSLLLSHCIFHPVQKALNRTIQIDYTLRIYLG